SAFETSIQKAIEQVQALLDQGDRNGARSKLESWREALGDCEPMQDLASRVAFAESAEKNRLAKLQRSRINEQLTKAATALGRGELNEALGIYAEVHAEHGIQREVVEVVETRMGALIDELARASKMLRNHTPPDPSQLFDRAEVTANLATLQRCCSPALTRCFDELADLSAEAKRPE